MPGAVPNLMETLVIVVPTAVQRLIQGGMASLGEVFGLESRSVQLPHFCHFCILSPVISPFTH